MLPSSQNDSDKLSLKCGPYHDEELPKKFRDNAFPYLETQLNACLSVTIGFRVIVFLVYTVYHAEGFLRNF